MAKKVSIDTSTCVGCGLCEQLCPEVFVLGSDGVAQVKGLECSQHNLTEIAQQCPVEAIKIK